MKDDRTGLDGLPETERTRIEALADRAQKDWSNPWQTPRKSHPETCPYRRDALNACTCRGAYDAAIAREVAAYYAAHPATPGTLTRAQAEEQLRAGGMTEPAIVHVLHYAPHAADLADLSTSPTVRAILRAYVRGQDVAGVSDAELAALASAQIADTGYRLDHIEPGDRDHGARAVMVKTGHDDPIRSPLFRLDTEPLLCLAQRLAREVCALRGMLAARAPATRVTGVRTATGMREELNEFAEQAWRDGTTIETFTDIREEPTDTIGDALRAVQAHFEGEDDPVFADLCDLVNRAAEEHAAAVEDLEDLHEAQHAAAMSAERIIRDKQAEIERLTAELAARAPADASLEARAKIVEDTLRAAGVSLLVTHPADGRRALQAVVRAVDASRPGLTEDQARRWGTALAEKTEGEPFGEVTIQNGWALHAASRGETGPATRTAFGEWPEPGRSGLTCPGCYAATGIAQPHDGDPQKSGGDEQ